MRERRYDAAPGIMLRALHGHAEHVRLALAEHPYPDLLAMVRNPPWWSPAALPILDDAINTMEFFIHHEDVRRGQPGWSPRELAPELEAALWRRIKGLAKLHLRRVPAAVVLHAPGYGETRAGRGGPDVRITGSPGELTMFTSGRQRAARVQLTGPEAVVGKLRTARLGL
jgi:uncharacterized protein (TIGR03085 family)